jgi:hypothetical protein
LLLKPCFVAREIYSTNMTGHGMPAFSNSQWTFPSAHSRSS